MRRLRHARFVVEFAAAAALAVIAVALVFAWRLSLGPLQLAFLVPYLEQALNRPDQPFAVRLEDAAIAWNAEDVALDLKAYDVAVLGPDGAPRVRLPELSVGLSFRAALLGRLAPSSIGVVGGRLHLARREDGSFDLGLGEAVATPDGGEAADVAAYLLDDLLGRGGRTSYLQRIEISDAYLSVEDGARGVAWQAPQSTIELRRQDGGLAATARLAIEVEGMSGRFTATGRYDAAREETRFVLEFRDLPPLLLARLEPRLGEVGRLDAPVSGVLRLVLDGMFWPTIADLELHGGAGTIAVPEFHAAPIGVSSFDVTARLDDGLSRLIVEEARFARGAMQVRMAGAAARVDGMLGMTLEAEAISVPIDDLAVLWPPAIVPGAYEWVVENVRGGSVPRASMKLVGRAPEADPTAFEVLDLGGRLEVKGATVHYLRPMRPATQVDGTAEFDRQHFLIRAAAGTLGGMRLVKGTVDIVGLDQIDQHARIAATVAGPTRDALALIDEKPLGYTSELGLDAPAAQGTFTTDLALEFPLLSDLRLADVKLRTDSRLIGFGMPNVVAGEAVEQGDLRVLVDKQGLKLDGKLRLVGAPLDVTWTRSFEARATVRQRIGAAGTLDAAARARLGFDFAPYVGGPVKGRLDYTENSTGVGSAKLDLDLEATSLAAALAGWSKNPGQPARAVLTVETRDGKVTRIPSLDVVAPGLKVQGDLALAADGGLERAAFERLAIGRTDIAGRIARDAGGAYAIELRGKSLDLEPWLRSDDAMAGDAVPAVSVAVEKNAPLDELHLGEDRYLRGVSGTLAHDGTVWKSAALEATVGDAPAHLEIVSKGGKRRLAIAADDASAAIALLGLGHQLKGGKLKLDGAFDDTVAERPLDGRLAIADLRVLDVPALAQMLTLASLTGIRNTLSGQGIEFGSIVVPFRMTDEAITIKEARAVGSELGISANGRIDRKAERIALEGELAPAYTLNSLIGRIPLLGRLITGGQDGLFAATYAINGPLDDPRVSVNPLTVLAPGFARIIIDQIGRPSPFDGETTPPDRGGD